MEGCVRCMLIMILATAVTAILEYNDQEGENIHAGLSLLDKMDPVDVENVHANVKWILKKVSERDIDFEIEDPAKSSGVNCGEGPKLIVDNGPHYCLYGITFHDFTVGEDYFLQLVMFFRKTEDDSTRTIIISELYKKPENPAQDLSKVVHVEPIPRQQLEKARNKQSFVAPVSWVKVLLDKGIYAGSLEMNNDEQVGDSTDRNVIITYTTYPIVMDADILNQILEIRSLQ